VEAEGANLQAVILYAANILNIPGNHSKLCCGVLVSYMFTLIPGLGYEMDIRKIGQQVVSK